MQDKWKDKGNYGYCCYTSCTSIGNKGNQCCACGGGASTATRSGGKTGTCDPQTCTAVSGCTTAAVCNAARKGSDCCQWRAGGCHQSSSCGSGATTASAAGCAGCSDPSKFEWQTDYHGADLIKGGLQASSPAECCKKCEVTASCKYALHSPRHVVPNALGFAIAAGLATGIGRMGQPIRARVLAG